MMGLVYRQLTGFCGRSGEFLGFYKIWRIPRLAEELVASMKTFFWI
jgi:hypothetical protein